MRVGLLIRGRAAVLLTAMTGGKVLFRASSEVVKSRNKKEKRADMEGTDEQKGFLAGLGQMIAAYAKGELSGRSEAAAKDGTQEGTQEGTEAAATQAARRLGEEAGKVEPEAKPDAPAAKPVEEPAKETTSDAIAEQVLSGVTSAIDKLEKSLGESRGRHQQAGSSNGEEYDRRR